MLYPCIENFGELVNSLLFRLAIQVSICKFCWRHQSCLEPFILVENGMDMMSITCIQLTLHCRVFLPFRVAGLSFWQNLLLAGLGCFKHITAASSFCRRLH